VKTKRLDLYQPNHSDLIGWLPFVRPISNRYAPNKPSGIRLGEGRISLTVVL